MQRKTLRAAGFLVFVVAASVISSESCTTKGENPYPDIPTSWTGYNSKLDQYYVEPGYPSFEAHPRYLGELNGSWYEIGKQYGERAGDLIRMVFEGWYREILPTQGSPEAVIEYIHQQETFLEALAPEAIELQKGIADGAKEELDKSVYAGLMTHYEKILMVNNYFGLKVPPAGGEGAGLGGAGGQDVEFGCSGAVIIGGTKDGKVIHVSSEDQHFWPQEYSVTYVANPSDENAHTYTVTDSAGEIGSQTAMNDKGVVVSGYAGGGVGIGPRRPGLDWQVGVWFATAFSDTASEAVKLLTLGTPEYTKRTGHKIVIGHCRQGVNWVVSDLKEAYVVESIPADLDGVARYAVRRPGDMGEIGDYIVSTNNVEADHSYNEDNEYDPSHPMSQHGNSTHEGVWNGLNSRGTRFWTFMQLIKNNYGNIDVEMVQEWRRSHFYIDKEGYRRDYLWTDGKGWIPSHLAGPGMLCSHGRGEDPGTDSFKGVNIYVSIAVPNDLVVYRTKGRPCEWVGPWDAISLSDRP